MQQIGVIRNSKISKTSEVAEEIRAYIESRGGECVVTDDGSLVPDTCSCALVLGGDGTLLRAARKVLDRQIPLLGINLGTLGYLAEVDRESMYPAIDALMEERYVIENRMLVCGSVWKNGEMVVYDTALNDITLSRRRPLRHFRFRISVNGAYLTTYSSDGVIVSTPTGSTGYNLSAGGPIVSPDAVLMILTPVAPHSLISRSIVFSGKDRIRIEIGEGRTGIVEDAAVVSFDGSGEVKLGTGDAVEISMYGKSARIIKINNVSFLEILRKKMAEA